MEVGTDRPIPFCHAEITLIGRLRLLADDDCGFFYRLEEARVQGDEALLDATSRAMERLMESSTHWLSGAGPASPLDGGAEASRRSVLGGLAAMTGAMLFGGISTQVLAQSESPTNAPAMDVRVGQVLSHSYAVDLHTHAGGIVSSPRNQRFDLAEQMTRGRFGMVTMSIIADLPVIGRSGGRPMALRDPGEGELFAHVRNQLESLRQMIADQGFVAIRASGDMERARSAAKPAMLIATEGGDFLDGKIERVSWAHQNGVRHLQLVHYRVNELGDIQTASPVHDGMTPFGLQVVRECNRLGMIVDVAHLTQRGVGQVVEASAAPIVLSHSSLVPSVTDGRRAGARLVSADHAKLVVSTGGMIGIWPFGYVYRNMSEYVDAIHYAADTLGIDHVGIGSDMEGGIEEVFRSYADYPRLLDLLIKRLSPEDVSKVVGGNYARVYAAVAKAASG